MLRIVKELSALWRIIGSNFSTIRVLGPWWMQRWAETRSSTSGHHCPCNPCPQNLLFELLAVASSLVSLCPPYTPFHPFDVSQIISLLCSETFCGFIFYSIKSEPSASYKGSPHSSLTLPPSTVPPEPRLWPFWIYIPAPGLLLAFFSAWDMLPMAQSHISHLCHFIPISSSESTSSHPIQNKIIPLSFF